MKKPSRRFDVVPLSQIRNSAKLAAVEKIGEKEGPYSVPTGDARHTELQRRKGARARA